MKMPFWTYFSTQEYTRKLIVNWNIISYAKTNFDFAENNFSRQTSIAFYLQVNCPVLGLGGQILARGHSVMHQGSAEPRATHFFSPFRLWSGQEHFQDET